MKLTVIVTSESDEKLGELIEGLKQEATAWDTGNAIAIRRDNKISGKYIIIRHNAEQDLDSKSVRFINGKIIVDGAVSTIESMLRTNKIAFEEYSKVEIPDPNARTLDIELPQKAELIYTPQS